MANVWPEVLFFMSRTQFEFGPTQINKSKVDSYVELISSNLIQFKPKLLVEKPKLLVKYVIIIYALGSAQNKRVSV